MTEVPRGWVDGLAAALEDAAAGAGGRAGPGGPAAAAAAAFASRLPGSYFERTSPAAAAADVAECLALAGGLGPDIRMAVQPDPDPGPGMFRLRVYSRHGVELSSFLPVIESFGLSVVEAVPHHIAGIGPAPEGWAIGPAPISPTGPLHLDDFGLRARGRRGFDPGSDGSRLVAAVQAAWRGDDEVDSLNRLVVSARLGWRDVVVLRAYRRYRRHAGTAWTDHELDDPLVHFPAATLALLDYFRSRFDPVRSGRPDEIAASRQAVLESLVEVERLEQDQVLRAYLGLVDATVRTSHYARTPAGEPLATLTLKLDSALAPELPPPRPFVETFVYSPRVEGLHLRGGLIARGGIRWSDRQDDLRTEVLGLVRAQVLKNAGIVPTGAKGAFVCKRLGPDDRPDAGDGPAVVVADEVKECYRLFIGGLLDITDNVVAGRVVPPPGVRPADGDDSYLVVAADRGTAQLSDLANRISAERGFWLGDAFASGGSHGYDHKAMAITARGAWVAVQQHFRQLGIDVQHEAIRVVGVGDMSGDVFGNGMQRSRTIKLVAAFDHRDIFVDPGPDPDRSFSARARLAELPRSSWQDYDRSVLSAGGGIWSRTTKQIVLAPEAAQALGLAEGPISPPDLMSAILTAAADLMWLGGIGTFVKGANQAHADVGDRVNDGIRVDADQVRARVVAEGGNLGFTQAARIAYSRRGGKINTDFIDNAAGVATSDYEVNLKILLARAIETGRLSMAERDLFLAQVAQDVAAAVLRDVGLSAIAVTRAVPASAADLDACEALMAGLEQAGRLDRKVEVLPDGDDMAVRRRAGAGLTRPEAAVLLAYAKSDLTHALEASPLATDPALGVAVEAYFPVAVTQRFGDLMPEYRLYPQLAATRVANEMVDRMGITWAHETADEFGAPLSEVAAGYWVARQVVRADRWWAEVESLAPRLPVETEEMLHQAVASTVETLARHYLSTTPANLSGRVGRDQPVADELAGRSAGRAARGGGGGEPGPGASEGAAEGSAGRVGGSRPGDAESLVAAGVDAALAVALAGLPSLAAAGDVGILVRSLGASVGDVVAALQAFDDRLGLAPFATQLAGSSVVSRWERWQARRLLDDVASIRRQAVLAALSDAGSGLAAGAGAGLAARVPAWLDSREGRIGRFERLAGYLAASGTDAHSVAALAVRALAGLVEPASGNPAG